MLITSNCSRREKTVAGVALASNGHDHLYDLDTQQKKHGTDFTW